MTEEPKIQPEDQLEDQPGEQAAGVEAFEDYDPMIYDAMREAANRLKGIYVARQTTASSELERDQWLQKQIAVAVEVDDVDSYSLQDVQALRASFVARLQAEDL